MKIALTTVTLLVVIVAVNRCGSASSGAAGELGSAHPGAFAVSSPTASTARETEAARGTVTPTASFGAKKAILEALFAAVKLDDCKVSINLIEGTNANCYGPQVNYVNHPENVPSTSNFPGGDVGIVEETDGSTQACAAAQMNGRIKGGASYADAGIFGTASMICAARVSGLSAPAVGASVDVTSAVAGLVTINSTAITVTSATLSREADTTEGYPVYVSSLVGTSGTTTYSIRLKHVPTGAAGTNVTNRGKVSVTVAAADGSKPNNCSTSSASGNTIATSVEYEKASASDVRYRLKSAQFCGSDADPYVSATNKTVDFTKEYVNPTVPKGWANNGNFLAASFDPSTIAGNYAYAWQAGMGDSNTRALNVGIVASRAGLTGTAFFAFGDEISTTNGSITKMICNWTGSGSNHTGITKAQKQVMTRASAGTLFTSSSALITYDPVNSCDDTATVGFTYSFTNTSGSTTTKTATAETMNLVDVSTISASFTAPTAPTAVE